MNPMAVFRFGGKIGSADGCAVCDAPPATTDCVCQPCRAMIPWIDGARCRICGDGVPIGLDCCDRCRSRKFSFLAHRSLFRYRGVGVDLLRNYKFNGRRDLIPLFVESAVGVVLSMVDSIVETAGAVVVVPAPSHPRNRWLRGWDPVGVFAVALGKTLAVPVIDVLKRDATRPQKGLGYEDRIANLRDAIHVRVRRRDRLRVMGLLPSAAVIVVDDVFTTGSTLEACARALEIAGFGRVMGLTLAMD